MSYFTLQSWIFANENFLSLLNHIPSTEKDDFDYDFRDLSAETAFENCLVGTQKYLFNTNSNNRTQARRNLKRLV